MCLRLLVLHGSRARGDHHAHSDWDFAYQAAPGFDVDGLLTSLVEAVHPSHSSHWLDLVATSPEHSSRQGRAVAEVTETTYHVT